MRHAMSLVDSLAAEDAERHFRANPPLVDGRPIGARTLTTEHEAGVLRFIDSDLGLLAVYELTTHPVMVAAAVQLWRRPDVWTYREAARFAAQLPRPQF